MYLLSIVFLLLHFISALSPDPRLWGVDSWSYMPGFFSYLFLLAGILPLIPKINDAIRPIFDKISDTVVKIPLLLLTLFLGVLLYIFSEEAFLSGDGLLRIRNMTAGTYIIAAEPLETFLHQLIYDIVNSVLTVNADSVYRFISIITGLLTFYLSAGYIKDLFSDQKHRNFMAMMLLTSGAVMVFFGYVETYTINTGVLVIYFLSTSKMLVNRKFSYIPMIAISFAVFLHTSSFVFLPTAMFAYYSIKKESEFSVNSIVRLISIFIVFALFSLFAVYISGYPFSKLLSDLTADSHILPLFSNDQAYGIFSAAHLIDVINLLFLTAPIIVALPVILMKLAHSGGFTPELKFLGGSSLLALFFLCIIKSDLGMARDWDLFALAAYPITIFSVTALIKIYDKTVYRVTLPLFMICIVHTAPWLLINSSYNLSVDRAEQLAESPHWTGHSKAILFDAVANEHYKNNNPEKALELSIKAYNNEHDDRFLFNIANGYSNLNQQDSAIKYFEILNKSEFKKELTLRNLIRLYMLKADYINSRKTLEELYNLLPDDLGTLFNLGTACFESEDYGGAIEVFTTILKSKTDHYEAAVKLGESYFNNGQYPQAAMLFSQALKKEPNNPDFHYYLAVCFYEGGNLRKAAEHAGNAKKLGFSDIQLINQLIKEL